jgi:O-antigen/teichoic acid export membrane protein
MIQNLRKNTFWLLTAQGLTIFASLILNIVLARHLGPTYNGIYNYATSIIAIFGIFVDFGMSTVLIRDVARDLTLTKKYLDNLVFLKIIIGIIILSLIVITSFFVKQYHDIELIMLFLGLYNIISGFNYLVRGIFRSHNQMIYEAYTIIFEKSLLLIFGFIALFYYSSLLLYTVIFAITSLIGFILAIKIIRQRFAKFSIHIDMAFWKYMLLEIWPYGISSIVVTIYFSIDQVILGSIKPIIQVGYYGIARSTTGVIISIIGILIGVLFPSFSALFKTDKKAFLELLNNAIKLMVILSFIFVLEMMFLSRGLILLVFGHKYINSVLPLQFLSISTGLIFVNALIGNAFGAVDKQKILLKGLFLSMIINIALNFLLIPKFAASGAAAAAVFTELFIGVYAYILFKRDFNIHILRYIIKPLIAAGLSSLVFILLSSLNVLALSIIGIIVYFAILILIKGISIEFIKDNLKFGSRSDRPGPDGSGPTENI